MTKQSRIKLAMDAMISWRQISWQMFLVELTPVIINQLKPGGIYITSGIIDDKEQTVVDAVKAAGLEVLDVTYQGEWVCVTARKEKKET